MNVVLRAAVILALASGAGVVHSSTHSINNATAPIAGGGTTPATLDFAFVGDGVTVAYQCDLSFDPSRFQAVAAAQNGAAACTVNNTTGVIRLQSPTVVGGSGALEPLVDAVHCAVTFTYTPDATDADGDTFALDINGCLVSDADGNPVADVTETDGLITVLAGPPPDVIAGSIPADNTTLTLPGGAPGDSSALPSAVQITVDSGTIGNVTVTSCSLSGVDAADFNITAPAPADYPVNAPVTIGVELVGVLDADVHNAVLECEGTDSSASGWSFSWPLVAPAGTTLAGPTLEFDPNGGLLTLPSGPAGNATADIDVTVTDSGDNGGPSSTASCSVVNGPFTVGGDVTVSGGAPLGIAGTIGVSCTRSDTGPEYGEVECSIDGGAPVSFEVECPQASAAPPPPTFIPATSLWSKFALIGVFAALGLLMVGLRRNH